MNKTDLVFKAITKILQESSEELKGVPADKFAEMKQVALYRALMKGSEKVLEALNDLLTNPTLDDIMLIALQTLLARQVFKIVAEKEVKEVAEGYVNETISIVFQYLQVKAEMLDNNEKVLKFMESHLQKKA